jgi:hypothetical protein
MNDTPQSRPQSLSPEYFDVVRRAYPAILAGAREARIAGYVIHPLRGKDAFLKGWPDLPNKEPLDIDQVFRSPKNECFNLGSVISADPQGDAPNIVVDVDLHGVRDQKDRDDCMAKSID